jgi:putative ABC transport system permease protein
MIKNYLKTALRSLLKDRLYAFINILGLSIGLGCFVLVFAFNRKELSYDKAYPKASQIFRINTALEVNGVMQKHPKAHFPAGQDMMEEFPEVKSTVRMYRPNLFGGNIPNIKNREIEFTEEHFYLTDSTFFDLFDFKFKNGDPATALDQAYSVVLTNESAKKYFGNEDPVGKTLSYNDSIQFMVTGVLEPILFNTHLKFDFVANARAVIRQNIPPEIDLENAYLGMWYYSYILVDEKADIEQLRKKIPDFVQRHYPKRYTESKAFLELQNVQEIHLTSTDMAGGHMAPPGNKDYVLILAIIGAAVLIVACFNFVNMATSRYLARSKEVGLRKAIGAERSQLIFQFISEASLITFLGGIIGLGLVALALPFFNQLANASLQLNELFAFKEALFFLPLFLVVGIISGLYPAIFLSSLKPALVLKGITKAPSSKFDLRKALVVLQFAVSLILVIGTLVVLNQLSYLQNTGMGFNREQVLMIRDPGVSIVENFVSFKTKLASSTHVKSVSHLGHRLGQANLQFTPFKREGKEDEVMVPMLNAGYDLLETLGLSMTQGRYFDIAAPGDSTNAFVINESAAKQFGWTDAVNRHITLSGLNRGAPDHKVIGVIKDFNFDPLRNSVGPLVIRFSSAFGEVAIKLSPGDHKTQVKQIEQIWKESYPDAPFNHYFLEDGIAKAYAEESKLANIYFVFCGLAIFIACLGLFALASYTIEKRKKEIAVRKVLGSTATRITLLMYKEFLVLIAFAFLLAAPLAYFSFDSWLSQFAYRITIQPWIFATAVGFILFLSAITVLYQSLKAGTTNPSTVLKSE